MSSMYCWSLFGGRYIAAIMIGLLLLMCILVAVISSCVGVVIGSWMMSDLMASSTPPIPVVSVLSLPFYKDWINVRLRLCYCCSALCLTLIQSWGTLVVTGKDDNCSGFSNAKFAIMSACRLSCLVTRERVTHENQNAILSLRPDRYCVSLIDPDQSRNTGKYYDS